MMFGGGNNPVVDIGISMTLQDRFSGPAGGVLSSWKGLLGDMNTYSNGIQQAFTKSINRNADFLKALGSTFEHSAEVQKNAFLTNKMLNDTKDHQADLLDQAKKLNLENPLNLMDITSGQKFMAMAGMGYDTITKAIKPAADMAAIFNMELGGKGGTADLMTNIMSTFQMSGDEAAKVGDVLAVGTTSANMSLPDLAQSIKYVGANARMAGLDLKDVTAAIGVLGNYGIQGSMAGTNLGQALNTMNKAITGASDKGLNALKALGLTPKDLQTAEGNLIPIHDILQKIAVATKDMGGIQKQGILFNLFGQRGMRSIVPLLEDIQSGANNYLKIMNKLNNSSGFLSDTMEEYYNTPKGAIDRLRSSWDNLVVTIGEASGLIFTPILKLVSTIITGISKLANTGFGKWLINVTALVSAFRLMRSSVGLITFSLKGVATNLIASRAGANNLATGLSKSNIQAAQLETHMRNIVTLLAAQSLQSGQKIRLWGGTVSRNQKGVLSFKSGKQPGLGESFFGGPVIVGAGATGAGAGVVSQTSRFGTPLYRSLNSQIPRFLGGRGAALGLARLGAGVAGGFGKLLGFLGGPWGIGISMAVSFLPLILDWLKGSKDDDESTQEDLDARQAARDAEIVKAVKAGKAASVNINLNGSPVGSYQFGDTADIDLFGDDPYNVGM